MRENSKIDVEKNKEEALMALANAVNILQTQVRELQKYFVELENHVRCNDEELKELKNLLNSHLSGAMESLL